MQSKNETMKGLTSLPNAPQNSFAQIDAVKHGDLKRSSGKEESKTYDVTNG